MDINSGFKTPHHNMAIRLFMFPRLNKVTTLVLANVHDDVIILILQCMLFLSGNRFASGLIPSANI
jgi:hypothetical protein